MSGFIVVVLILNNSHGSLLVLTIRRVECFGTGRWSDHVGGGQILRRDVDVGGRGERGRRRLAGRTHLRALSQQVSWIGHHEVAFGRGLLRAFYRDLVESTTLNKLNTN